MSDKPLAKVMQKAMLSTVMRKRKVDAHKGIFGHVLVIGGAEGMGGAALLAALGAQRIGAGLVSLLTHKTHAAEVMAAHPSLMVHAVDADEQAIKLITKASAIVIGPGLGQDEWGGHLLALVAMYHPQYCVIDADGLNMWSNRTDLGFDFPVLTPHPGEASRMLGITIDQVQQDRLEAANKLAEKYEGICVLKGAGTVVMDAKKEAWVCPWGNPGMAVGGMGDVLAGVIGGLLAQGLLPAQAAVTGVGCHALAGDMAAHQGGERSLVPEDILPYLAKALDEDDAT